MRRLESQLSWFGIVILGLLWSSTALAASPDEIETSASADPSVVSVGDTLTYKIEVRVQGDAPIEIEGEPDFGSAFSVRSRRSAPRLVVRNGRVRRSRTTQYELRARATGKHTIRAPRIRVGSTMRRPDDVSVKVVDGSSGSNSPSSNRNRPGEPEVDTPGDGPIQLHHQLEPDSNPYIGQQVTLTYRLLADPRQISAQPGSPNEPNLDEFWIEDLSSELAGKSRMTQVGRRYMKSTILRSYALFALESGKISIEPMQLDVRVGGFMSRKETRQLESKPLTLEVQPLPSGAPDGFYEGNVGRWSFRVATDSREGRAGEPMTVRLIAEGTGNVGRLKLPELESTDGFEVSHRDEEADKEITGTDVGGRKVTTYTIVPRRQGTIEIPTLDFSFFDPEEASYETISSKAVEIAVREGAPGTTSTGSGSHSDKKSSPDEPSESNPIETLLSELSGPIRHPDAVSGPPGTTERLVFWVGGGVPLFGIVLLAVGPALSRRVRQARDEGDGRRDAANRAKHSLEQITVDSGSDDPASTIHGAIRAYLGSALSIPGGQITCGDVEPRLREAGLDDETVEEISAILEWCESRRFSPSTDIEPSEADSIAERAAAAIDAIERARRGGRLRTLSETATTGLVGGFLITALLVVPSLVTASSPEDDSTFEEAVALQDRERWKEAADRWRELETATGELPTAAAYNLGTALAHLERLGEARLHLERAARTAPGHGKIRNNIEKVRKVVELRRIEAASDASGRASEPGVGLWKLATGLDDRALALGAVICLWIALLGMLGRRRWRDFPYKFVASPAFAVGLLGGLAAIGLWGGKWSVDSTVEPVVVTAAEGADLRRGPSENATAEQTPFPLVAGTMLRVEGRRNGWLEVRVGSAADSTAWLRANSVSELDSGPSST